jgi:hypothetical protein
MGSPTRVAEKAQQVAATGQLIVTDKAVVFEGDARNERLTWRQVADVGPLENGVMISRRTGKPRVYVFTKTEPRFSAVLWIMSHRT